VRVRAGEAVSTNGGAVLGSSRGIEMVYEYIDRSGDKVRSCQQVTIKYSTGTTTLTDA
jgi:hypothetical protein